MTCGCSQASSKTEEERKTVRIALMLNVSMFAVGIVAGYWAQSTGMMADALDMLTDGVAYALALMAITRGPTFKRNTARWTGGVLIVLGASIVVDVVRRGVFGSEPLGVAMMVYSVASFAVNLFVLLQLSRYRRGEVHLRASYICTRADVIANIGVFVSGGIVAATGLRFADLVVGFAIGIYVLKEAAEILREASEAPSWESEGPR
jgi:Co/Zn/Cd efflux system component